MFPGSAKASGSMTYPDDVFCHTTLQYLYIFGKMNWQSLDADIALSGKTAWNRVSYEVHYDMINIIFQPQCASYLASYLWNWFTDCLEMMHSHWVRAVFLWTDILDIVDDKDTIVS